ncbi:unnamed protein product [Linum trigynum]|uniref:F-box domain-containing protein n=1 Tax=Linum trigynum TaxID=586398 RepID=A0AAV2GZE0_9ROSI
MATENCTSYPDLDTELRLGLLPCVSRKRRIDDWSSTAAMAVENCTSDPDLDLELRLGLLPCAPSKRRRVDDSEEVNPPSPIGNLGDDLLAEVLIRLPEPRSAWQCKAVCKRWNSLIFNPHFARRFISHHQSRWNRYGGDGGECEEPALMTSCFGESILSFLPLPDELGCYGRFNFLVFYSYKDLVLCGFRTEFQRSLFICNPFTEQWIALPLAPETRRSSTIGLRETRLVCEPSSNVELDIGEGQPPFVYSSAYRFRVVCIYHLRDSIRIDLFCSESGEWTKEALVLNGHFSLANVNVVSTSCNGGLFWLCMNSGVLGSHPIIAGFNPFRLDVPPIRLDTSRLAKGSWNISVSQGALHLISLAPPTLLSVWRLEEDRKSWSMQHKTVLGKTIKIFDYELEDCDVACLHPEKPHIVFFKHPGFGDRRSVALSYDMKTAELGLFGEFVPRFQPRVSCWPTPIPRYEELRAIYDGRYSCWVQQSSSKAATLSLNNQ